MEWFYILIRKIIYCQDHLEIESDDESGADEEYYEEDYDDYDDYEDSSNDDIEFPTEPLETVPAINDNRFAVSTFFKKCLTSFL